MRPKSIEQFEKFFLGSLALGLVNTGVSFDSSMRLLEADSATAQSGFGSGFYILTILFGFGISLLLWYLIARRASNIAKWILVALTAFGLISMVATLPIMMAQGTLTLGLTAFVTLLHLVSLWFLFQRDAAEWLASAGRVGPVDPATFE